MTDIELSKKLAEIKKQEEKYGVEIEISQFIDKDHLDCLWYGGEVGTIKLQNGYIITIGAYGDIFLSGYIDGSYIYIKDKSNNGNVYSELGHLLDDRELHKLLESDATNNRLVLDNNNWFEVDLISPKGEWIDLCGADNVLEDNLLDCFTDIETYFEYVKWAEGGSI